MRVSLQRIVAITSLMVFAACREAPLIEYQGSATSEAIPDSAASLTITFWSQEDDTTFSGYVRSDAPLVGRGSAYAWHERSALRIATVSSRGDTVIWKSQAATDSIGGRYEFVGGPQTGAVGTWRAHLTRGPAASPATRRAGRVTVIPVASIVTGIALLALLVAAARWVRRLPHPNATPPTGVLVGRDLEGIGGWLAFFAIGQIIIITARVIHLPTTLNIVGGVSWELGRIMWSARPVLTLELAFQFGQLVFSSLGVYLIFTRSKFAPRYYLAILACMALFLVLDIAGTWLFSVQIDAMFGLDPSRDANVNREFGANIRDVLWALVWSGYCINSLRVRTTFGCDALDRPLSIPRAAEQLVATPSTPNGV